VEAPRRRDAEEAIASIDPRGTYYLVLIPAAFIAALGMFTFFALTARTAGDHLMLFACVGAVIAMAWTWSRTGAQLFSDRIEYRNVFSIRATTIDLDDIVEAYYVGINARSLNIRIAGRRRLRVLDAWQYSSERDAVFADELRRAVLRLRGEVGSGDP
jgi:hypothetical protein